jgi:membrane associated rhomboid family serine protease
VRTVDGRAVDPLCTSCQRAADKEYSVRLATFGPAPVVTIALVTANFAVYVVMLIGGASWIEPNTADLIRFGADFGPLTFGGQWWRLFTNMFVHIGIIHLALNMWCLWYLGGLAERVMSRKAFVFLYLASGFAGSLASELWDPVRISAGASGAVFGAAGGLVSFIYLRKAPIDMAYAKQRLKGLATFIAINLFYGLRAGVDNAAHVGGVVAGLAIGAALPSVVHDLLGTSVDAATGAAVPAAPPLGAHDAAKTKFTIVAAATTALLVVAAIAVAHRAIPKMRAERLELIAGFESGTADLIPVLENRVQKNPEDFAGFALLAEEHLFADDAKAAIAPFQKALSLNPRSASTHHNLAVAYLGTRDFQSAKQEIAKAEGHGDPGAVELMLGMAEDGLGHFEIAIQHYQKAAAARPDLYEAEFSEALAYVESSHIEEARALYTKISTERPDDTRSAAALKALNSGQVKTIADFNPPQIVIPCDRLMDLPATWPYLP